MKEQNFNIWVFVIVGAVVLTGALMLALTPSQGKTTSKVVQEQAPPVQLQQPTPISLEDGCSETDNGKDYFAAGTSTETRAGRATRSVSDYCISQKVGPGTVVEYYCYGDVAQATSELCANGCVEGACVR